MHGRRKRKKEIEGRKKNVGKEKRSRDANNN